MLPKRDYSLLNQIPPVSSLRRRAPLWLVWTAIFTSLSIFLVSLLKIMASSCFQYPLAFLSFYRSRRPVSVPPLVGLALVAQSLSGGTDSFVRKSIKNTTCEVLISLLNSRPLCETKIRHNRYAFSYFPIHLIFSRIMRNVYKLRCYQLSFHTSIFILPFSNLPANLYQIVLPSWSCFFVMASSAPPGRAKEKGKALLENSPSPTQISSNSTNLANVTQIPTPNPLSGGSSSKKKTKRVGRATTKIDFTEMFRKLAEARENGIKKKELTLVGFLVGERKEFPRIFAKLRMEWKPLRGTLAFNVLKFGWFEIIFSNQVDLNMIWVNRPYHLFSQLLLIKQWYPGFDPTSESISILDLWVRLHFLPEEFANKEALETIIEGNGIGSFLKMDPSHNSERWNLFTRFCINTDVETSVGRGVIVPDDHFNKIKYSLWFDDFSPGCGACGKSSHTFRECPNKNAPTPTIQLTFKKPSARNHQSDLPLSDAFENEGWNVMGKKNKTANFSKMKIPKDNVYLSERGGISVIYESDNSEEGLQHLLDNEEITLGENNLISVAADLHPYNIIMQRKNDITTGTNPGISKMETKTSVHAPVLQDCPASFDEHSKKMSSSNLVLENQIQQETSVHITPIGSTIANKVLINQEESLGNMGKIQQQGSEKFATNLKKRNVEMDASSSKMTSEDSQQPETPPARALAEVCNEKEQLDSLVEQMQEYDDEQYDYEYDDLLMDELVEENNSIKANINGQPFMISEDPPFSEQDLEDFTYNDPIESRENLDLSEGTFHSLQNSFNSSSSFVNGMERLIVHQPNQSKSTSSKRRVTEGIDDTASSEATEVKRPKI